MTMKKAIVVPREISPDLPGYGEVLTDVACLLESARRAAARSVNAVMTATYREAGDFLIGRCEYADGFELYSRAVKRFPDIVELHQGVGCCAGHLGRYAGAVAASRRAVELDPTSQKAVNDLGWSLYEAGKIDEARATLERAVAMDPGDELAAENLRLCKTATGSGRWRDGGQRARSRKTTTR